MELWLSRGFETDFRIDFGDWGFWIPTFVGMTVEGWEGRLQEWGTVLTRYSGID